MFLAIWLATVASNVGGWMYSAAAGWLMADLKADAVMVAAVQAASTLPMFLFAIPSGALADVIDKRIVLLFGEICVTATASLFAAIVWCGWATPIALLLLTFLSSTAVTLTSPAWQAVVPQLVPKQDLAPAIAANSVGMNLSRAVGPALGGGITAAFGIVAPFCINAVSNLGVIALLAFWRSGHNVTSALPVERLGGAIRVGIRHARYNPHLRSTGVRACGFFVFASAYWALLPLIARNQLGEKASDYGFLLGAVGLAAVVGAAFLQELERRWGADRVVVGATVGTAIATALFAMAPHWTVIYLAALLAGASWIAAVASLNVSAQVALPDWVRARGLAIFVTIFYGALSLGSLVWGSVADVAGLSGALFMAASGLLVGIPLTARWKLHTGAAADLAPSMHWPAPVTTSALEYEHGPVLVTVEYQVELHNQGDFLQAMARLGEDRKRDGAYAWGIFQDAEKHGQFVEAFLVESWAEHLRQHARVTAAGRDLQKIATGLTRRPPVVSHLVSALPPAVP